MAATVILPSTSTDPITTDSIVLPFGTGPIDEIMNSVPTQSVEIDIRNSAIHEVLPRDEIVLGVIALSRKPIDHVVGLLIAGKGFGYEVRERRGGLEGYFDLWIESSIFPLPALKIARALHALDGSLSFYFEGNLVAAL